ncbi:hypothetical protein [Pseudomonas sp. LRF_L74]|uniref:hypothetical protein n=1 Tax=Pseudomonas sp. LRF_L74 TaxID=3369422 RepID=UPI003F5E7023
MKSNLSPYARALLSRTVAAIFGGYALTCALVIFLGAIIPLPKGQAVLAASLASFAIFTAIIIWAFSVESLRKLWLWLLIPTVLFTAAGLLIGAGA